MRRAAGVALLAIITALPLLSAQARRAQAAEPPPSRSVFARGGFLSEPAEPYLVDRGHFFGAAGLALPSTESTWLTSGWTITGGAELPVRSGWSFVARAHATGASTETSGTVNWFRLMLDGRISQRRGGVISYLEAGLGGGLLDSPVSRAIANLEPRVSQRTSGVPCFQLVGGLRGDPDVAPAFQIEVVVALGLGAEHPSSLELLAGIAF
jgi:hypothetical protein